MEAKKRGRHHFKVTLLIRQGERTIENNWLVNVQFLWATFVWLRMERLKQGDSITMPVEMGLSGNLPGAFYLSLLLSGIPSLIKVAHEPPLRPPFLQSRSPTFCSSSEPRKLKPHLGWDLGAGLLTVSQ